MRNVPEIQEISLVLVGDFLPEIITPQWLAWHELISSQEAAEAHHFQHSAQVSKIDISWGKVTVEQRRLQIATSESPLIRAKDFVVKLLLDALPGTPIDAVGINFACHYSVGAAERESIGRRLAPRDILGEWGNKTLNDDPNKSISGLTSISYRQGTGLEYDNNRYFDLKITTSRLIMPNGLMLSTNDHYSFADEGDHRVSSHPAARLIEDRFEPSMERSASTIDDVFSSIKS